MRATTQAGRVRALGWAVLTLGTIAGCGGAPAAAEVSPPASAASDGATTAAGSSASSSTALVDDTGATTDLGTDSLFLANPDLGEGSECDYFVQDCAPGLKCMPWGSDGGTWNASHCTPIAEDPAGVDEPCRVEGYGISGRDDCDIGLYCWYVDPETSEGRCIPLCIGSEATAYCSDPERGCWVSADASISICFPVCDPLAQDCIEGQGCYYLAYGHNLWECAEDASGGLGAYGDPCEHVDACDPGLVCVDASTVPPGLPCEGALGCCTELCDLDDPAGDAQCMGAEGSRCVPLHDEDEVPPQFEHVGACALPQ